MYITRRRWNVSDKCAESRVEVVQTGQHLGKPRSFVWIEAPAARHDGKPTHQFNHAHIIHRLSTATDTISLGIVTDIYDDDIKSELFETVAVPF